MNRTIRYLYIAFAVQIALVAIVLFINNPSSQNTKKQLVTADLDSATIIRVESSGGNLELKKVGEDWLISDYGDLEASKSSVQGMLDDLKAINLTWPAAKTDSAAERFEVSESNTQKKLSILNGDTSLLTLHIGTSPGFRKQHVRLADSKEIYSVEIAQHRISEKPEDWFDKGILKAEGNINTVKVDGLELHSVDDQWSIASLEITEKAKPSAIKSWVDRFSNLELSKYVAYEKANDIVIQNPVKTVTLLSGTTETGYAFYKADEQYFVKRFDDERLFELASYQATPIIDMKREDFVESSTGDEKLGEAETSNSTIESSDAIQE